MADVSHRIDTSARLTDPQAVPRHGPYRWPLPISRRVEDLVDRANGIGAGTNVSELVAAILCDSPTDATELKRLVEQYRVRRVADTMVHASSAKQAMFVARGRGRPRGR